MKKLVVFLGFLVLLSFLGMVWMYVGLTTLPGDFYFVHPYKLPIFLIGFYASVVNIIIAVGLMIERMKMPGVVYLLLFLSFAYFMGSFFAPEEVLRVFLGE